MNTTPSQLMVGLSLLALASASAFASDPTPVSASSASSTPVSQELQAAFPYQPKSDSIDPAPVTPPAVTLGDYSDTAKTTPVQMKTVQVKVSPERQARALTDALAYSDPTLPHALYTKDLPHNLQFEALCGPIYPILGEDATHGEQPRFPVVGLNW